MEYVKGTPYFCKSDQKIRPYPYLNRDICCDILIVGGGINGAIANYFLCKDNDVILVEKSRLGHACTSCATALLEYQLDDFAENLKKYLTPSEIVQTYKMGKQSFERIEKFVKKHGNLCQFSRRPTFLYTANKSSKKDIEAEFEFRTKNGFDCALINEQNNPFPFDVCAGILCEDGGCEFNPYLFEKMMIDASKNQSKIFENTGIRAIKKITGGWIAKTDFGESITCKKIVVSTGFNWEFLNAPELCERFVSYSIVTEPIKNFKWYKNALVHDASEPYHYARILPDNRIIFGGEDTNFCGKPIDENLAQKKYVKLEKQLFEMLPQIAGAKIDFEFCGLFGTTKNNLGLIGQSNIDDDLWLFLSCGANGIVNAMSGIDILLDLCKGKSNKLCGLFSPKRKNI